MQRQNNYGVVADGLSFNDAKSKLSKHNMECLVNKLPIEVLMLVFEYCVQGDDILEAIRLSQVCLYWHMIISKTSFVARCARTFTCHKLEHLHWMVTHTALSVEQVRLVGDYKLSSPVRVYINVRGSSMNFQCAPVQKCAMVYPQYFGPIPQPYHYREYTCNDVATQTRWREQFFNTTIASRTPTTTTATVSTTAPAAPLWCGFNVLAIKVTPHKVDIWPPPKERSEQSTFPHVRTLDADMYCASSDPWSILDTLVVPTSGWRNLTTLNLGYCCDISLPMRFNNVCPQLQNLSLYQCNLKTSITLAIASLKIIRLYKIFLHAYEPLILVGNSDDAAWMLHMYGCSVQNMGKIFKLRGLSQLALAHVRLGSRFIIHTPLQCIPRTHLRRHMQSWPLTGADIHTYWPTVAEPNPLETFGPSKYQFDDDNVGPFKFEPALSAISVPKDLDSLCVLCYNINTAQQVFMMLPGLYTNIMCAQKPSVRSLWLTQIRSPYDPDY